MPLVKIADFYPEYQQDSEMQDFKRFDVYAQDDDKVGSVHDILVDGQGGRLRYFVVDTGFWIFGKKVLLPVGRANIGYTDQRIYASNLTKEQIENLPNYDDLEKVDYDYEERVRGVYRPVGTTSAATTAMPTYDRNSYQYDHDADLYNLGNQDQQPLKLYEERLIANKQRQKTGEVTIGKHVETESTRVSVPVEKERVVIERSSPTNASVVNPGDAAFREGQVAHVDVYEETPDIHKEAFVREEVQIRKEVEQDTVTAEETLRREELDVNKQGRPGVKKQR